MRDEKLRIRRDDILELTPVDLARVYGGQRQDTQDDKTDVSNKCCDPTDPTITCQPTTG
jgi:hypothetical protein